MRKPTGRTAVIATVTAVAATVAVGGTAAWAAGWFRGTGLSTVSSATVTPVTAQATVTGGDLWPGVRRDATVSVTNQNEFPVRISGAALTSIGIQRGDNACTLDGARITLGAVPDDVVVPAKPAGRASTAPTAAGTFPRFIRMGRNADAVCAGATILVSFSLEGAVA